jgi:regulator of chromosome condensation (RCC1) repeat-containing protein
VPRTVAELRLHLEAALRRLLAAPAIQPEVRRMGFVARFRAGALSGALLVIACQDASAPGAAVRLVADQGDGLRGILGRALELPMVARALDDEGHGVPGVPITWTITDGDGAISVAQSETAPDGRASAVWTLGPMVGAQHVSAASAGVPPITFTATADGFRARSLAIGAARMCALDAVGAAWCWTNAYDRYRPPDSLLVPTRVATGMTFTELVSGRNHQCGLDTFGTTYCWGNNSFGQLGDGSTTSSSTPVRTNGGPFRHLFSAPDVDGTCGIDAAGTADCWGQMPLGTSVLQSLLPVSVAPGLVLASVAEEYDHVCAVTVSGAGYCWGNTTGGQLGIGPTTTDHFALPMAIGGEPFSTIVTGSPHSCGLRSGVAYCWGWNLFNALGIPGMNVVDVPTPVATNQHFTVLALDGEGSFALGVDHLPYWWGSANCCDFAGPQRPMVFPGAMPLDTVVPARAQACGLTRGDHVVVCWLALADYEAGGHAGYPVAFAIPASLSTATNTRSPPGRIR